MISILSGYKLFKPFTFLIIHNTYYYIGLYAVAFMQLKNI